MQNFEKRNLKVNVHIWNILNIYITKRWNFEELRRYYINLERKRKALFHSRDRHAYNKIPNLNNLNVILLHLRNVIRNNFNFADERRKLRFDRSPLSINLLFCSSSFIDKVRKIFLSLSLEKRETIVLWHKNKWLIAREEESGRSSPILSVVQGLWRQSSHGDCLFYVLK